MVPPRSRLFWWLVGSAVAMAVGAVAPWARVFGLGVSGVDGDGRYVLIAAVIAGAMLAVHDRQGGRSRWPTIAVALMGIIGLAVAGMDVAQIVGGGPEAQQAKAFFGRGVVALGWGLVVTALASVSLALAAMWGLAAGPQRPPMAGS